MTDPKTPPRPTPKSDGKPTQRSLTARAKAAANDAGDRFTDELQGNPIAVLAGGIALGLVAGALLPKSAREKELIGGLGAKLTDGAAAAARAARDAGQQELSSAGISRGNASDQLGKFFDLLLGALANAGTAAGEAAKESLKASAKR